MQYKFERGKPYELIMNLEINRFNLVDPERPVIYVRKEKLTKPEGEWETFYTYFGGVFIDSSDGLALMDGELVRARINVNDLRMVRGNKIFCDGEVSSFRLNNPEERTSNVQSWLEEVDAIQREYRQEISKEINSCDALRIIDGL